MSAPLLTTKLYIPPPRPKTVPRPRLLGDLNDGLRLGRRPTLVSAPAGFGKTTLVAGKTGKQCTRVFDTKPALCFTIGASCFGMDGEQVAKTITSQM